MKPQTTDVALEQKTHTSVNRYTFASVYYTTDEPRENAAGMCLEDCCFRR